MLFNSSEFFALLALTLCAYWSLQNQRLREHVLLTSSLFFYAYWYPPYLILLFVMTTVAYATARMATRSPARWPLTVGIVLLLGTLAYFKYAQFIVALLAEPLKEAGFQVDPKSIHIELPLGISFIVFQAIAYIVDVYRREIPAEPSFRRLLLFKAFFPQLIAGPICRGHELLPQLRQKQTFDVDQFSAGTVMLALGLFLKTAFADTLSPFVDRIYSQPDTANGAQAIVATLAFGIQILADFWGYSTMAVGMALMLGIRIPFNFNLPYLATSLRDFWRRWHITLSNWLRDYLYKPLGGSRAGPLSTARNLLLTMGLGGLWHGANMTFVFWGLAHGTYLVLERVAADLKIRWWGGAPTLPASIRALVGWFLTMNVVFLAWILFRADSVHDAATIFTTAFALKADQLATIPETVWRILAAFSVLMVPMHLLIVRVSTHRISLPLRIAAAFWLFVLSLILGAEETVPFIYFQF